MKVASLHIYPVKSLGGVSCSSFIFEPWGPERDRRWMVVDAEGRFLTQRQLPVMAQIKPIMRENGLTLTHEHAATLDVDCPSRLDRQSVTVWKSDVLTCDAGDKAAEWLSSILGKACRLVYMDEPQKARKQHYEGYDYPTSFADGFPGLLCTEASLNNLNERLAHPVPMERFRPNIVVSGALPWAEDQWGLLAVGEAVLRVVKPCSRCIMTTVDQASGHIPEAGQPLKELGTFRRQEKGIMFGQNVIVEKPGRVKLGDSVRCL